MPKFNLLKSKPNYKDFSFNASVSKIKTFDSESGGCALKYRYSYVERLPKKEWDFHFFGKFSHRVLELFHRSLIQNPNKIKDSEFCIQQMAQKKEEGLKEFGHKLTEEQKKETFQIFEIYLAQYLESQENGTASNVLAVEDEFYVDLDGKMLLQGVIDKVEIDFNAIRKCTDYKTSKEMGYLADDDFQLQTYCFVEALRNPEEQIFRGSYVMLKHECQTINFQYTRDQVMQVGEKFLAHMEEIQKEKLFRPTTTPLCYFCDYNSQKLCPEGYQMTQIIEKRKKEKELRDKIKANKTILGASSW